VRKRPLKLPLSAEEIKRRKGDFSTLDRKKGMKFQKGPRKKRRERRGRNLRGADSAGREEKKKTSCRVRAGGGEKRGKEKGKEREGDRHGSALIPGGEKKGTRGGMLHYQKKKKEGVAVVFARGKRGKKGRGGASR